MKFEFEENEHYQARKTFNKETLVLAQSLTDKEIELEDILNSWLCNNTRELTVTTGYEEGKEDSLMIMLEESSKEVGNLCVPESEVFKAYPQFRPVSDGLLEVAKKKDLSKKEIDYLNKHDSCDEKWFSAFDTSLKLEWHDDLCSQIINLKNVIKVALAYGLAKNGEVSFTYYDNDSTRCLFEDDDLDLLPKKSLIQALAHFNHEVSGRGFGQGYVVL